MNAMLKIHPLMLAAAIAFWGWQTAQWIVAAPAGVVLCSSFYVSLRWALTTAHLTRVADFCTVLALLFGGYLYVTYGNPRAVILFFEWLPLMFLPLALAYAYGTTERMDLRVLFWSARRRPSSRTTTFDPWWPYFALWIVAAAAANARGEWFYIGLVALVSWPLVRIRPWSYRVGTWGVAFSIAIALGYGLHYGLHATQGWLENAMPEWISNSGSRTDPYRATTDIGHIGGLKDSDAIVLRVTTPDGATPPALLHRASYNTYFGATWLARGAAFTSVDAKPSNHWPLIVVTPPAQTPTARTARMAIYDYTARPNPVLSLPTGTSMIEGLGAITVQRNTLGAVQIVREPGYFSYGAAYAGDQAFEGAPTAEDVRVPQKERETLQALASELGLNPRSAAASVERVKYYFANGYQYSTFQKNAAIVGSPIVDFLLRAKAGHCEYFATATALLLRAGGVPARYATGFAVTEKSDLENAYLVRQRHAHAWVRAHVNGEWIDVDTTPPSWFAIEAENSSAWTKFTDRWSWLRFRASQAWANGDDRQLLIGALVVFPFALWLAWRLYHSRQVKKNNQLNHIVTLHSRAGADSEFYRVEAWLSEQGWGQRAHETAHEWLARLNADAPFDCGTLAEIVELHNRYRFDPQPLAHMQRARLAQAADAWLAAHATLTTPSAQT